MGSAKRSNFLRKMISFLMVFIIASTVVPWLQIAVYAFDQANYDITSVTIYKIYDSNETLQQRKVLIQGHYLKDSTVGIITSTGYQALTSPTINTDVLLQYNISGSQLGNSILINNTSITLDEALMPTITGVTRKISVGTDDLYIQGTKLQNVTADNGISASFEQNGVYVSISQSEFSDDTSSGTQDYDTDSKVRIETPNAALGLQNIIFQKASTMSNITMGTAVGTGSVNVNIQYTYQEQTTFIKAIDVDGLEMHPNRGVAGSTVYFEAPNPNLDNYDVFFVKAIDGTDPYTNSNKGTNKTFSQNSGETDILTVQVPAALAVGEYYVVLTNPISSSGTPSTDVVQEMVLDEKYTVIDGQLSAKISAVQPNSGSDTGSKTTITGQFLISMNVPEFTADSSSSITIEDPAADSNAQELIVNYGSGTYNNIAISNVQRKISVIIGSKATFLTNSDGDQYSVTYDNTKDMIDVKTPQVTDADTNPKKDVVVETTTTFTKSAGGTIVITERASLTNGYTYIPSTVTPSISDITPSLIQVDSASSGLGFVVPKDMAVAIHGSNFMITQYTDAVTGDNITRYPVIEFGPELTLDKNTDSTINLKVFDASGNELDGTSGNEIGTKILVTIPAGKSITQLGKNYVSVINPVRNSDKMGLSDIELNMVEFVNLDSNKIPVITSVTPEVESVDGGDTITVEGSNFTSGVKVYIDAEEVSNVTRQGDGKELTFKCPAGTEGEAQLEVMNTEGGIATWTIIYVETYTNPSITGFSPAAGKTGTLVMISGDNFMKPDPTGTESYVYNLIGTRVTLGNTEVNEYNRNETTGKIEVKDYTAPSDDPLLSIDSSQKKVKLANYYSGILLYNAANKSYYTLEVDSAGTVTLTNGAATTYTLGLSSDESTIVAQKSDGTTVDIELSDTTLIVKDSVEIDLTIRTLYKVDSDGEIIGNRVKVINKNTIYVTVPILSADGYYDVTVINPDSKKASKTGKSGFYYYSNPQSKPEITNISPSEGSTEGGYTITITGEEFEDDGTNKSKVYINGVLVDSSYTTVSTDGTSLTVKVPAYSGDLQTDNGTSILAVPVIIVNSDGGSASDEDGFTYIVPGSHPKITKIVAASGSAAGGDIVEITGSDFRFYESYSDDDRDQEKDSGESYNDANNNGQWDDLSGGETLDSGGNDLREPTAFSDNGQYTEYYASPILPKIYFGSKQAKIVEYSKGYIKVVTPSGTAGATQVYILNNDSGISNMVTYTYKSSNPVITGILPAQGKKQGKDNVEIFGTGFTQSRIDVYTSVAESAYSTDSSVLVRFGSISNRSIPRDSENSGRIDNGRTTVALAGGLTVGYDSITDKLTFTIESNGTYTATFTGYDDSVKYVPVSLLTDSNGNVFSGYELIRVEVSDRRLYVDRGYSPAVTYISSGQLEVSTPSYYSIGTVVVTLQNPDGGTATGSFEYKNPASDPSITNITKEGESPTEETINSSTYNILRMSYKGGSIVSVSGEDFRENAQIQISNVAVISSESITYSLPNKLTFTMPAVSESAVGTMQRVVVLNEDGGSAYSDELSPPIYIIFTKGETSPTITSITPEKGSSGGGTEVKITGTDFRETMDGYSGSISVYFGDIKVPDSDVTVSDYKTIYVNTPSSSPGEVKVRVENPDGEISTSATYTYISGPVISSVADSADSAENTIISTISVDGGEEIKLKGSGYMEGAKVVFNPVITEVTDTSSTSSSNLVYIDGTTYTLESGIYANSVTYIDSETLTVVTPEGKVGTKGVMIINTDGGASDIYNGLTYTLYKLSAPTNVTAELIYDRYIKVNWKTVDGASQYEIYVVTNDKDNELAGSTTLNSFVYSDLESNTKYKFVVKAIGSYGASEASEVSNSVRTGSRVGPEDEDGGLTDNTTTVKSGDAANVSIGRDDFDEKSIVIDLTRGTLAGCKEITVSMPASVVTSTKAKDITIVGKNFLIKFNPYAFSSSKMSDNKRRSDAGIKFKVSPFAGSSDLSSGGCAALSPQYILEACIYVGTDVTQMSYLSSQIQITMDYDTSKAQLRKLNNISINRYDGYNTGWTAVSYASSISSAVTASTNRLGRYMVIGRRN